MWDIKEIEKKFNKVIEYSQNLSDIDCSKLLQQWKEAKKDFIEAMDGELIYEFPRIVDFELDEKTKNKFLKDFIDNTVEDIWNQSDLADFLRRQQSGFYANQVVVSEDRPEIPIGMKLLKAFKFFVEDEKVLRNLQDIASDLIQKNKVIGKLCISVHPLDYLSVSENANNWRSCHALDGEYRAGNLSYMVDKSTIICYLKPAKDKNVCLPNFPEDVKWNTKEWRVLLFFDQNWDMMFAGRQYPFASSAALDYVKDRILPIINMGNWLPWEDKKIKGIELENMGEYISLHSPYVPVGNGLVAMNELIVNEPGSLQYNDLLSSTCYDPLYTFRKHSGLSASYSASRFTKIRVGGRVQCLRCGQAPLELNNSVLCLQCEMEYGNSDSDLFNWCDCCGRRFISDDGFFIEEHNEYICPECAETQADYCECCGALSYKSDLRYSESSHRLLCTECYLMEGED